MYGKEKLYKRLEKEFEISRDETDKVYNALIELMKRDLSKEGKFVLYPVGEIILKKRIGRWYDNHDEKVVEGEKLYFKFVPFKNYRKELKH
ncbi:MAG: HU family DNA-binding protein [Candidatus Acidifodinimicrobium sp.]